MQNGDVGVKIKTIVKGCKCFWVVAACLAQQEMAAEQGAIVVGFGPGGVSGEELSKKLPKKFGVEIKVP